MIEATLEEQKEALSEVVCSIDYDTWKEMYSEEASENDEEEVNFNYEILIQALSKNGYVICKKS